MEKLSIRRIESADLFSLQFIIVIALQFILQKSDKMLINICEVIITISFLISLWLKRKYNICNSKRYKVILLLLTIYILRLSIMKISNLPELIQSGEFTLGYLFLVVINVVMTAYVLFSLHEIGFDIKDQGLCFSSKSLFSRLLFLGMSFVLGFVLMKLMLPLLTYDIFYKSIFWSCFIIEILSGVFAEEVLFRGALLSYLLDNLSYKNSSFFRTSMIIMINAAIFMIMHGWERFLNPIVLISFVAISVFGCISRIKTGNVLYATILHAMYNSMIV